MKTISKHIFDSPPGEPANSGESPDPADRRSKVRMVSAAAISIWVSTIAWGLIRLHHFESLAGAVGITPTTWPSGSRIKPVPGSMTLVMVVHPQCSCTRASLKELEEVLGQVGTRVAVWVLFVRPTGLEARWEPSETRLIAQKLSGVTVLSDEDGAEALRLGAMTSGDTVLYDQSGRLAFAGGITGARGHIGPNIGRESLVQLIQGVPASRHEHQVFGCSLQQQPALATPL